MSGLWTFDPHLNLQQITIVGLGGTGSNIARITARILYDLARRNRNVPRLVFVDPDRVEMKNVGRQGFSCADAGHHLFKAEALARRFSLSLGLEIGWHNEPFDPARQLAENSNTNLVIGCVDNHLARQVLAAAQSLLWLDAGNGRNSGQVCIGNSRDLEGCLAQFDNSRDRQRNLLRLPNAAALFPDLLLPEPVAGNALVAAQSCAELVEAGDQGLVVNDLMAAVCGQLIYRVVNRLPLVTFLSYVDGDTLNVRSLPISRETIQEVVHS